MAKTQIGLALHSLAFARMNFLGAARVVYDPREPTGADLMKAIADRDEELVKQMATMKVNFTDLKDKLSGIAGLKEQLATLEQRIAEGGVSGDYTGKSIGQQFVDDDRVKSFLSGDPTSGKIDMRVKATITSATSDAAGSVGAALQSDRQQIDPLPQRRLTVRDLVAQGTMTGSEIEWPVQKALSNNAAPVAEGDTKPQSDLQFEMKTSRPALSHTT